MRKRIFLFIIVLVITLFFVSLQSILFDTFTIEPEKDIFLEFQVDIKNQYKLFVIDSYNSNAFGISYNLEYAIVSVYKKDKKTLYPSTIYTSPFKDGGITTSNKEAIAIFKPVENIIYIRIRGTSIKSFGKFGFALLSSDNKKVSYKISKSIFDELHKEAILKNNILEYKLLNGKALLFTYFTTKGKECKLTIIDAFNNNLFNTYFSLDGAWFHVMKTDGNLYYDIYTSTAEGGGITSLNDNYSAKFISLEDKVLILVEPISLVYEGTFGIKLEIDGRVIKPESVSEAEPIGYESKVEEFLTEDHVNLDILEINDYSLRISFDTKIGKTYYIYLADNYNADIFKIELTFKDLFFQIYDDENNLIKNCYYSEITFEDQPGGITYLNNTPSAMIEATKLKYYILIKSLTRCASGTFGLLILDSNQNIIQYQILTN